MLDPTTPIGRAQLGMLAVFAEFEHELLAERARDTARTRRSRCERLGRVPYGAKGAEDPAVVVDAFRAAGSYSGAAKLLNAVGMPSSLGRGWSGTAVRLVVTREEPAAAPRSPRRGARSRGAFPLSGLLRCHCGATLTGGTMHGGRHTRYHCHRSAADPAHARPGSVAASFLEPFVRSAVDARAPSGVDWSLPAAEVNRVLREQIEYVQLGPDLRPTSVHWREAGTR